MSPGDVDEQLKLMMINAVYFKGMINILSDKIIVKKKFQQIGKKSSILRNLSLQILNLLNPET